MCLLVFFRREVYRILNEHGVETPRYEVCNRSEENGGRLMWGGGGARDGGVGRRVGGGTPLYEVCNRMEVKERRSREGGYIILKERE